MGFVIRRARACSSAARATRTSLALDLHDQWAYMEKTTQWRFTPPTHVVAALDAALDAVRRRGRAAGAARALHAQLRDADRRHGGARLRAVPRPARSRRRSSSPSTRRPIRATTFKAFYEGVRDKRLHPLSGQAHAGRDVPRRLHRRDRSRRDAAGGATPMRDTLADMRSSASRTASRPRVAAGDAAACAERRSSPARGRRLRERRTHRARRSRGAYGVGDRPAVPRVR